MIGEVELAWRLRGAAAPRAWLAVTGTNGKTTTVRMLESMLRAGRATAASPCGNVGARWSTRSPSRSRTRCWPWSCPASSCTGRPTLAPAGRRRVLNVAADHLDWHGSMRPTRAAKARIFAPGAVAVGNADDPRSPPAAGRRAGADRVVPFTLGAPGARRARAWSAGLLVDRAFGDPATRCELAASPTSGRPAPHNVANALAAAALARASASPPERGRRRAARVRARPAPDRAGRPASAGCDYVDDSKATNPHAAPPRWPPTRRWSGSPAGQLKGADVDDAGRRAAPPAARRRCCSAPTAAVIAAALARHAPDVPVVEAAGTDTGVMDAW